MPPGGGVPTVEVISAEQTSQTYLTPPSPPLVAVFLRMTPMVSMSSASSARSEGDEMMGEGSAGARIGGLGWQFIVSGYSYTMLELKCAAGCLLLLLCVVALCRQGAAMMSRLGPSHPLVVALGTEAAMGFD